MRVAPHQHFDGRDTTHHPHVQGIDDVAAKALCIAITKNVRLMNLRSGSPNEMFDRTRADVL